MAMKIVQVITELRPGGAERVLVELCRGLLTAGHSVHVISLRPLPSASVIVDSLMEAGATIVSLNVAKFSFWRIFRLRKAVAGIHPDIVHAHLFHANIATRICRINRLCPVINTVHTTEVRDSKSWYFLLDRLTFGWCDCQTAVSEAARDFHAEKMKLPRHCMPVIYNGIMAPRSLAATEVNMLRSKWGVAQCAAVIGSVGRLEPEKGFDVIVKMLPELSSLVPPGQQWGVVLIGEGRQRKSLEELSRQIPADIVLALPGFREDAAKCIGAFDLFIMPSRYEGFGLALIEAMAHGVPVIANDIGPLRELLRRYSNGELLDFFQPDTKRICAAVADALLTKGKGIPDVSFTSEKMVRDYIALYQELIP